MKKILLILVIVIMAIAFFAFKNPKEAVAPSELKTITVNNKTIAVEIADTPSERRLGLSGRESLKLNTGLLFIFDTPDYHSFWMKDMNFPIDIFWLDENYQIVDSWLDADPASFPKSVAPKTKAKYVLETNVGEIITPQN